MLSALLAGDPVPAAATLGVVSTETAGGVPARNGRERGGSGTVGVLVATAAGLAALIAAALTAVAAGEAHVAYGLPDPGAFTRYGLPIVRVVAEVGAVMCIGSLLLAAFGIPARRSGALAADGYAAVRGAGWAAGVWGVGAALMVPFTAAGTTGSSLRETLRPEVLFGLVTALAEAQAWSLTALIAFMVALACRVVLSWGWTVTLLLISLAGLLPVIATGHSASGGGHDVATNSLLFHLFGATLWVGGLVALLAHAARHGNQLGLVTRRFSALALVCWIAMAVSGVVNSLVRVPLEQLLTTTYGLLVVVKTFALVVLGVFGYFQRRHAVARIDGQGGTGALLRLGAFEVLTMFATVGVAVALGRTPPPGEVGQVPSTVELLIGYPLAGPPTVTRFVVRHAVRSRLRHPVDRLGRTLSVGCAAAATAR